MDAALHAADLAVGQHVIPALLREELQGVKHLVRQGNLAPLDVALDNGNLLLGEQEVVSVEGQGVGVGVGGHVSAFLLGV